MLKDQGDAFWTEPDVTVTVPDDVGLTLWTLEVIGTASPVGGYGPGRC